MLIVDCPSPAFLPALLASPPLRELATGPKRERLAAAVHLSPREVAALPGGLAGAGQGGAGTGQGVCRVAWCQVS